MRFGQLKAHRQISKKQCFEKYCSCDRVCKVSALEATLWRNYLENLTIDDKLINKQVPLFIHQTMCREEKIVSTSQQAWEMFNYFFKKDTKAATGKAEAATGGVL